MRMHAHSHDHHMNAMNDLLSNSLHTDGHMVGVSVSMMGPQDGQGLVGVDAVPP